MAGEKQSKIQSDVGGKQADAASAPGASAPSVPSSPAAPNAGSNSVAASSSSAAPSMPTPAAAASAPASSLASSGPTPAAAASAPASSAAHTKRRPPGVPPLVLPVSATPLAAQSPAVATPVAPQSPTASSVADNSGSVAKVTQGNPVAAPDPGTSPAGISRSTSPIISPINDVGPISPDEFADVDALLGLTTPQAAPLQRTPAAAAPVSANNSGGSAAAPSAPATNTPPPGRTPDLSPRSPREYLDELLNDRHEPVPIAIVRRPNVGNPVSPPPPSLASSSAAGGAPSAPVGANKSYSDQLDEVLNNATSTSAKPLAAARAPSAAAVPLGGNPSRPPPAVASAPAASGQAPGQLGVAPLRRNQERSESPPPARQLPLGGQARQWVPPASRSGGNTSGSQSERAPAATNAGSVPVQGMRAVPSQPARSAPETPTGSASSTPEITQLMGEMRKLDREAELLRNITTKWEESVKAELTKQKIDLEKCDKDRVELFKTLLESKSGTPPAENVAIEAIIKRRDEAVLRGAPTNEITGITKELTTKMGKAENDPRISGNLSDRDEVLETIKQANDIESAHKMKLPGNGLVGADGTRKDEFNKADIASYQTRLQEIALNMAALKQQIRTAQDTPRASAPEPNDGLENPNPGDPRKKIEDVVKLIAQDPNVNNCKKVSEGEYQLDFKTVPPAPINVSKNKVTAPKGADETTMRKQCQVFFDLMDKTGRKDFTLDDVKVSGADEVKLKALLVEEFANRYGTSISLNARDPSTPTPPIEPQHSVAASIGGPRGGMGGHRG